MIILTRYVFPVRQKSTVSLLKASPDVCVPLNEVRMSASLRTLSVGQLITPDKRDCLFRQGTSWYLREKKQTFFFEQMNQTYLPHQFIVTIALSENLRHVMLGIWIKSSRLKIRRVRKTE